jgi:hypothetical protein
MEVGGPEHEPGTRFADLGAVEQQPNVACLSVPAAFLEAVRDRFQAGPEAAQAFVDTTSHLVVHDRSARHVRLLYL